MSSHSADPLNTFRLQAALLTQTSGRVLRASRDATEACGKRISNLEVDLAAVRKQLTEATVTKEQALLEAADARNALSDAQRRSQELTTTLSEKEATLQEVSQGAQALCESNEALASRAWAAMEKMWGALSALGIIADPPQHSPEDGISSLATLELGAEHLADALHGYRNVCAQTANFLAFVLALKVGVGPTTSRAMKDKIPELPSNGKTLLEEIKLCRPAARVFLTYWEDRGRQLVLAFARAEAEACEFQALSINPGQAVAEEMAAAAPAGDATLVEPRDDGNARTATPDAHETQV